MKTTSTLNRILVTTATGLLTLGATNAAFSVYDDFSSPGATATKWEGIDNPSNFPTIAGGTATLSGSQFFRSTTAFPIGSMIRIELDVVSGGAMIVGTNSNVTTGYQADDALYTRDDGGAGLYVDGAPYIPAPLPTVGFMDYVIGSSNLEIFDDGVSVFVFSRPADFEENQRIEIGVYPNGGSPNLVVDQVLVDQVPEPASLGLLSLGTVALLARRRRS